MARNPRRMALYEVIKSSHSKVPTSKQGQTRDSEGTERSTHGRGAVRGLERRLAITVSYRIVAVCLLVLLLILMMSYRMGQKSGIRKALAGQPVGTSQLQNFGGQDAGEEEEDAPFQFAKTLEAFSHTGRPLSLPHTPRPRLLQFAMVAL